MKPTTTKDEIRAIMQNGDWHSIREIAEKLHYTRGYIKVLLGQMWLKRELKRIHPSRGTTRTLYILAGAKKAREYEDGQRVYQGSKSHEHKMVRSGARCGDRATVCYSRARGVRGDRTMKALLSRALIAARNRIWDVRKAYKGDAFEHERQRYLCGDVYLPLEEIAGRLKMVGYELNELTQYEDMGQVLSGHLYRGLRQVHVRFFFDGPQLPQFPDTAASYECRAHEEYSWKVAPIRHIRGVDVKNACPELSAMFADVMVPNE